MLYYLKSYRFFLDDLNCILFELRSEKEMGADMLNLHWPCAYAAHPFLGENNIFGVRTLEKIEHFLSNALLMV